MAVERTLNIIKPDAVEQNNIGNILAMIQGAGLKVLGMRMLHLSRARSTRTDRSSASSSSS
jgi:nucleoside-diphosphate kinase